MKKSDYTTPSIKTVGAREIVSALGPASAGSGVSKSQDAFDPSTNACGFPMGYPCP